MKSSHRQGIGSISKELEFVSIRSVSHFIASVVPCKVLIQLETINIVRTQTHQYIEDKFN